jgi:hypothetical protein
MIARPLAPVALAPNKFDFTFDVAVTSPFGSAATAPAAFRFVAPPPVLALGVHGVPPSGGLVTFGGSGFQQGATVTFGGVASPSVSLDPVAKVLVATAPPHAEGFVDVVVTNPDGQSATIQGFHYGLPPAPTAFTPGTVVKPGDLVTITGSAFSGVQVMFSNTLAQVVSQDASTIVVAAPKMNPGSYPVIVTNFDGQYHLAPGVIVYP